MPKNKGKGGKNRRRGKNENESEKRELVFKEDGQEYAQVIKMLGNGRLEAMCFDGTKRLCHIRGKLRKKVHNTLKHTQIVGSKVNTTCIADSWVQTNVLFRFRKLSLSLRSVSVPSQPRNMKDKNISHEGQVRENCGAATRAALRFLDEKYEIMGEKKR
uniref:Eukaryotic translation initiation factor 4C n=1 Tax=Gouania willdenowi TaxID=441366 RepID=A0A8C5DTE5_GOUWI